MTTTNTFVLSFMHYEGSPIGRQPKVVTVEARSLNAAIAKVERQHPEWFYSGCVDYWKGAANTWGIRA